MVEREKLRVGRKKGEEGEGRGDREEGGKRDGKRGDGRDKERRKLKLWEITLYDKEV